MRALRLPISDSVTRDGETVVMCGDRVLLLSPMAGAVLRMLDELAELDALSAALVREFGPPPEVDPQEATQAILEELSAAGLVRLEKD